MAMLNFDASQVAPKAPMTPVPAGTYLAHIIESDIVPTKAGDGQRLKLTFEILDGQLKGRRIWEGLNIQHANGEAQRIAQSDLSAICHAVGVIKPQQTEELHFKPVKINVAIRPASGQYGDQNVIKGYESASGAKAPAFAAPAPGAAPAPAPAAPAQNAPVWARKA